MGSVTMSPTSSRAGANTPAAIVAMVGAGQLAQMTQQAAISLGVELRVLAKAVDDPAVLAGATPVLGLPDSVARLREFAQGAQVLTFDHEQVSPELLAALTRGGVNLQPSAPAHLFAQDKLHQRRELQRLGFPVPPFIHTHAVRDAEAFAAQYGWPLVAKVPRGGYDGRGVFQLTDSAEADRELAAHPDGLLLEPLLQIKRELAVLVARSPSGEQAVYPVAQSVQRDAMCREILAPAPIEPNQTDAATHMANAIAGQIGVTGIAALELFETPDGLLVNELALRPHNSGHYTIEGCATSQFEQHLRAVLDWPLGSTALSAPAVAMVNIVGNADGSDPRGHVADALRIPGARLHLYSKSARPGRKLGHVTVCAEDLQTARSQALRAAELIGSDL